MKTPPNATATTSMQLPPATAPMTPSCPGPCPCRHHQRDRRSIRALWLRLPEFPQAQSFLKEASTHDLFTKSCLRPTEPFAERTSGQRQLAAQHNRWSRHRLQKPKFNKGAKILKPKFQTRARRKQHRTRGPTVLLARQRRYRPAGLAGCRCTQSWFAGSSGRLRPRKHESIQNTSCLDIASLFIRQGFGTWNSLFHRRQTLCYQRTVQLW